MKTFTFYVAVLSFVLSSFCAKAQISIDNYRFYIDEPRKLIVSDQLPAPAQITAFPIQIKLGDQTFTFADGVNTLSVGVKYTITNSGKSYSLYFTELPVINLQITDPSQINQTDEIPGAISLSDGKGTPYNSNMAIRIRGNSSSFFPKKSYRVQLKDGAGKNKDESLLGLRNDKRWLFLALWNEELRANNMISHNLWIDMHKVYYAASEPKAISSIRMKYVEVFMNKSYLGVYGFAEDMDRKQLALKKEDGGVTHGELYKADDWSLSAAFAGIGVAKAEPGSADWQHWELEYPDYSDWQNHYNFLKAVIESSDNDFKNNIGNLLKIDNLIDYFIFANVLLVEDNMEKNYFLGRYDQGEPYFIIPWDLDATWSYFPDGKRSNRVEGERTSELYKRLFRLNPDDFKNKLATRWFALRQNLLTENNLKGRFSTSYNTLNSNLVYERESLVAQDQYGGGDRSGGLNYVHSFITQRLAWLDNYFCPMVAGGNCNNPVTCNFAIAPTANAQSYTPQQAMTFNANCTGADCGSVTYAWTGNGANATGASTSINAPSAPGDYTYTLTASKAGCADKTASLTIHVATNTSVECDFNVTAAPSNATPACSAAISLNATCSGANCSGVAYQWTGNGINLSGMSVNTNAPATNGTFNYTVTATKNGCATKTATAAITVANCQPPTGEPFSLCLEAENSNGNGPVTDDPNASGGKTRGDQNNYNHYVDYAVNGVKATGVHQVKIRYYANGNALASIAVNGSTVIPSVQLPATFSWNIVWREETINVTLNQGNNTLRIQGLPGYALRQDKICVTGDGSTNPPIECDFNIAAAPSNANPACSAAISLTATCSGANCSGVAYQWTGNGINLSGISVNTNAPGTNGTFNYTVTATKNGCATKTATASIHVANCQPPTGEPFSLCLEAENSNGNGPVTDDPNASAGKTRGDQNNYNHYVDYAVNGVKATGVHQVKIRYYANGNALASIAVNGSTVIPSVQLPATYSWNIVWREETINVTLNQGNNTLRIQGLPGYALRQDKICVTGDGSTNPPIECDFNVTAAPSNATPACSAAISLTATCSGANCSGVAYQWTGNGINLSGMSVNTNAPGTNGTFNYTVTATKNGCATKTATASIHVANCQPPTGEPFSLCLEAENSNGNGPVTDDPNASGGFTRGDKNNYNHYVDYAVNGVKAAGTYQLKLRYYASDNPLVSFAVNGNVVLPSVQLPSTHTWNIVWREEVINITLAEGNNMVRIQGLAGPSCRQDKICVTGGGQNARMGAPETKTQSSNLGEALTVYPNPSTSHFEAKFQLATNGESIITVTDMNGKKWYNSKVKGKGNHQEQIRLNNAPAGIYILQIKKGNETETKKLLLTQ